MVILRKTTGGKKDTFQRSFHPTKMVILGFLAATAGTQAIGSSVTSENLLSMFLSPSGYTRVVDGGLVAANLVIGEFSGHCGRNVVPVDESVCGQCRGVAGKL